MNSFTQKAGKNLTHILAKIKNMKSKSCMIPVIIKSVVCNWMKKLNRDYLGGLICKRRKNIAKRAFETKSSCTQQHTI